MLSAAIAFTFAASAVTALASLTYSARELVHAWPSIRRAFLSLEA
jgi:hypothetical protein